MAHQYAKTMFSEAARKLQEKRGSRAQYERMALYGPSHDQLSDFEIQFIAERDSFYMSSVTEDGWPYIQHRGGPPGFLRVIDPRTLAFADYAGNKQYITAGNLATNDRVALFLMDYPNQARLKIIGHGSVVESGADPALDAAVRVNGYPAKVEWVMKIDVTAYDWNCSQHITPRYTQEEIQAAFEAQRQGIPQSEPQ
jgi:predicted pyridoxine 5'-phosphate oxidase superfamily flavin-nucleotide-binding protein